LHLRFRYFEKTEPDFRLSNFLLSIFSISSHLRKNTALLCGIFAVHPFYQHILVRVVRLERTISTSQMWRGTSSAIPGYLILSYNNTVKVKKQVFYLQANSLAVIYPDLAREWDGTKNGSLFPHDVTAKNRKRIWWRCDRGHSWQMNIN
jgi:hypothetical protein